jgi:hypothetical protein
MSDPAITTNASVKLGRQARVFRPQLNLSAVLGAETRLPVIPASLNNGDGMPTDWGMMVNDQLGDCTCAAFYHGLQLISHKSRHWTVTEPDKQVVELYKEVGGYVEGNPSTDNGAVEQDVLSHLRDVGAPIDPVDGRTRHRILGFAEVNHRILDDVRRAIFIGGFAYIGFTVPVYLMQRLQHTWDVNPSGDNRPDGGHAVILSGYDPNGFRLISWGVEYYMTNGFFWQWTDEVYLVADPTWLDTTGHTPANMTKQQFVDFLKQI